MILVSKALMYVSDIAIFMQKGNVKLQLTKSKALRYGNVNDTSHSFTCYQHL